MSWNQDDSRMAPASVHVMWSSGTDKSEALALQDPNYLAPRHNSHCWRSDVEFQQGDRMLPLVAEHELPQLFFRNL